MLHRWALAVTDRQGARTFNVTAETSRQARRMVMMAYAVHNEPVTVLVTRRLGEADNETSVVGEIGC